jgi:hypothetical protein
MLQYMRIGIAILALAVGCSKPEDGKASPVPAPTFFVFARITDPIPPLERGEKYEDPLDDALKSRGLGEVTGGGSSLDGGKIEWIGVDLELKNLDDALIFARDTLRRLGAPAGSVLEYKRDEKDLTLPIR